MKERKTLATVCLVVSIAFMLLDLFLNYRMHNQLLGYTEGFLLSDKLSVISYFMFSVFGYFGKHGTLIVAKISMWVLLVIFCANANYNSEKKVSTRLKVIALSLTGVFFLMAFISPFEARFGNVPNVSYVAYFIICVSVYIVSIYYYSQIGKTIQLFQDEMDGGSSKIEDDPFGRYKRVFAQQTKKLENRFSVNIPYKFLTKKGMVDGFINIINPFRAVLVMGTPGSGKSYGTFLPAIYQFINKGFTVLLYDFKFKDLTEYAYQCYLDMLEKEKNRSIKFFKKTIPQFCIFSLEQPLYSERCNVFQPHIMKDFVVDALGLIKAFFLALNPSWKNKEGDFFPESAINVASAGTWGLNIYQPKDGRPKGSLCSLPHLIEFMSQDVESIIKMLIKLKDGSLVNVIKPFEEAMRDGALEQLQGQMGTVRITLSRLTSPKLYYMLTEEIGSEPFDLVINSPEKPKIMSLANSGQNQGVNNIVLSLFLVQICRFVNKKGQLPLFIELDEAVTLSFPKSTLDTLIATGRGHLITVWVGIQDKVQLIRDVGKDVAEAIINMIGNYITGSVKGQTARFISDEIGDIRVMEKSTSVSSTGEKSHSYSEKEIKAVPPHFISTMSQGTMCGVLSDDFDQKSEKKAFYGEIQFKHPFKTEVKKSVEVFKDGELTMEEKTILVDQNRPGLPYSAYWTKVLKENCEGMTEGEKEAYVQKLMDINFKQVVMDIAQMKADLLGEDMISEEEAMRDVQERMERGKEMDEAAAEEERLRQEQIAAEENAALQEEMELNVVPE